MIEISKQARQQLQEFRDRRGPDGCVRIGILSGSTSGPSLGVVVDDKSDSDTLFDFDGLEVIIDKALLEYCQEITVDYVQQEGGGCGSGGFRITPKISL